MIIPLKLSAEALPSEYQQEFSTRRVPLVRTRVGLHCTISTIIYFLVTLQYLVRRLFFGANIFRSSETPILVWLVVGTIIADILNRRAKTERASKRCAYLYTFFFLSSVVFYASIYWEYGFLFCFYFGSALILVALMIPWAMREIAWLSATYTLAYVGYISWFMYVLNKPIQSFPRFHPVVDGAIFMGIAATISVIVRYNELRRDISNFMLLKKIEVQTAQFEKELELAHRVHQTLIPVSFANDKANIAVTYLPMGYVGGDYAKFRFLDENRLIIFISDVTGHGVPAALLVNRMHAEFERLVVEDPRPKTLLKSMNRFIARDFEGTQMYLSAFYGLVDFKKKTFSYSNYGHLPQYLYSSKRREVESLDSHTSFLGILFDEAEGFEDSIVFEPGDNLLLFTDGVVETKNSRNEFFGEERLKRFILENVDREAERFNEALTEELKAYSGNTFNDDIFILNVKTL